MAIAEASLKNEFWEEKSGEEFMIEAWCENVMLRSLLRENAAGEHDNAIKQIYRRFESRNSTLFTE
ncbi:MAG: hypothetical protein EOP04_15970 [Proteobacteria bacterium]|nr:MAG: hypothetical protein EOP04_15970 [Pseudomonadota bacterium]